MRPLENYLRKATVDIRWRVSMDITSPTISLPRRARRRVRASSTTGRIGGHDDSLNCGWNETGGLAVAEHEDLGGDLGEETVMMVLIEPNFMLLWMVAVAT